MNFILDTSAYSAVQRGNLQVARLLNEAHQIFLPAVVEGELRAGFAFGTKTIENNELLDRFLTQRTVSLLYFSPETPKVFVEIYAELRRAGRPIGQNDLWIAALAREHRLPILTLDTDFAYVKGIEHMSLP